MKLIPQNETFNSAKKYSKKVNGVFYNDLYPNCDESLGEITINDFIAGVEFAESKLKNLSIEFADWIDKIGYVKNENVWSYWDGIREWNTKYTTKELFEEFLKERTIEHK